MPHTLPAIIAHVTAQNRPGSHGAILVREIERLRSWIAAMTIEHPAAARNALAGYPPPTKETTDV